MPTDCNNYTELVELALPQQRLISLHNSVMKGKIASSAMHQLYNVLFSSLSSLERISEEAKNPVLREKLSLVREIVKDGTDIVSLIQYFFKGEPAAEKQEIDINKVIDDALAFTNLLCKPKPQFMRTQIHIVHDRRKLPKIIGNHLQLTQAFADIIVNAIEALPKGGQIILRTKTDRKWITVTITDSGTGISQDLRNKVFDPFFTTKGVEVTGLGLTVAKTIIENHGGLIDMESRRGLGSTFTVRLPGVEYLGTVISPESSVTPRAKAAVQGQKILLIDDEEPIVELLSRILEKAEHMVTSAYDGREGVNYFREGNFDAVFIDLFLPDMSGLEVAKKIRNLDPQVKIIMLTAWGEGLDESKLKENGIDLVAPKPFTINTILNLVG